MNYGTAHWRTFNRFVRVFGLLALLVGACFVWASATVWRDGTYQTRRADAPSRADTIALFVVGLVGITIGVSLVRVRPYRPDLGDAAFRRPTESEASQQRQWWTGDRRSDASDRAP